MTLGAASSVATSNLRGLTRWISATTSTTFTDAQIDGLLNRAMHEIQNHIERIMDHWEFRGQTATANLVADQQEYTFPTDILKPYRIEIRYRANNQDWVVCDPIDERGIYFTAIGTAATSTTPIYTRGNPRVWFLDQSFFIDPQPDQAVTTGIRIWYTQEVVELSATTDEPIFIEAIHPWLCYYVAREWHVRNNNLDKAKESQGIMDKMLVEVLQPHYSKKFMQRSPRIMPRQERYE